MVINNCKMHFLCGLILPPFFYVGVTNAATETGLTQTLDLQGTITAGGCSVNFPSSITFPDADISKLILSSEATTYDSTVIASTVPAISVTNCSPSQTFTVTLMGESDPDAPEALANDITENKAEHVGMRLYQLDVNDTPFIPNVASSTFTTQADGSLIINIVPALVKTTDSPSAGDVHITGQFQINYL